MEWCGRAPVELVCLGFPKLGVPVIRAIVFWGLYRGPLVLGNYLVLVPMIQKGSAGMCLEKPKTIKQKSKLLTLKPK